MGSSHKPKNVSGNYKGTDKDEWIVGSSKNQKIDGRGGNDALAGRSGNDTMLGGKGNDHLAGDQGKNKLTGGSGKDNFFFQYSSLGHSVIRDFSKGDKIILDSGLSQNYKLKSKDGDSILSQNGKEFAVIKGYKLSKSEIAKKGDLNFTKPRSTSEDPEEINRSIDKACFYYDDCWTGTNKSEKKTASKSKSTLMIGFGGNDTLIGSDKNDKLEGKEGNDRLEGGNGNDELQGDDGNDVLLGGKGNDRFKEDDDGKNTWTGGKGKDKFEIDDDEDGFVKIKDFTKKEDKLVIDDDYEFWEDSRYFVKGGNTRIELDGEFVAELVGYTGKIPNSAIHWD